MILVWLIQLIEYKLKHIYKPFNYGDEMRNLLICFS